MKIESSSETLEISTQEQPGFADGSRFPFTADDTFAQVAHFRLALLRFQQSSDASIEQFGIGARHYQALLIIHNHPDPAGIPIGELARQLNIKAASATGMIERMEAKSYVKRLFDTGNRRLVRLELQPEGQALLARVVRADQFQLDTIRKAARELASQ